MHVYIVYTMLKELLYPLQDGNTPLHLAAKKGHTTCVEHLLSTPGIDVNIKNRVSWSIERCCVVVQFDWEEFELPKSLARIKRENVPYFAYLYMYLRNG